MDRYMDLKILPDPEFPLRQLMNALYTKFHRGLVRTRLTEVGVSFPEVDESRGDFGRVMRLHGTEQGFGMLMGEPWLAGMRDHLMIGAVSTVPPGAVHQRVRRVQLDSNPDRLRRRLMKRHGLSYEQACARIPDDAAKVTRLPYLQCDSGSTGHRFRLFIEHRPVVAPVIGMFNAYGLSATATVPRF